MSIDFAIIFCGTRTYREKVLFQRVNYVFIFFSETIYAMFFLVENKK